MEAMVEDLSSGALLAALDANMVAFWSAYGRADGGVLHATPEVVWYYSGIPLPMFNGVLHASLAPEGVAEVARSLQALIDERRTPALWWIGPQSRPDQLRRLLAQQGLRPAGEVPGMAMDLALLGDAPETIDGFTMQRVDGPEARVVWAQTAGAGTEFPDAATDAMARLEAGLTDSHYLAQHRYVGYLDGTPVATSALVLEAGVAGIYAVATLAEVRGKGMGTAMTAMPLREARRLGYRVGILQASAMGYPIYRKMGFKDVCKYDLYFQAPR
jgi:GNAT superfamily N-acetyltransferase